MVAIYSLAMIWWEIRLLVSTYLVLYLFRDIIEEFHHRLFEIYCSLYTAPCTIETTKVHLDIYKGVITIYGCCLCLPDDEIYNPWTARVIARAGKITVTCHPIRYLVAYLGTAGDLLCARFIEVDDVEFVIEKRPSHTTATDGEPANGYSPGPKVDKGKRFFNSSPRPKRSLPPLNFSCQLMGRHLARLRLGIPDYDTGSARGIVKQPVHLRMPKARAYVIPPPHIDNHNYNHNHSHSHHHTPSRACSSSRPPRPKDREVIRPSSSAREPSSDVEAEQSVASSPGGLDILSPAQALQSTYTRIRENTSKLYKQAIHSKRLVSSALTDIYRTTKAGLDATMLAEVTSLHRRLRGEVVLRRHDLCIQADLVRVTNISVQLINALPPHLRHLEQKVLRVKELLMTDVGYPEVVYGQYRRKAPTPAGEKTHVRNLPAGSAHQHATVAAPTLDCERPHALTGGSHALTGGSHALTGGSHALTGGSHALTGGCEQCKFVFMGAATEPTSVSDGEDAKDIRAIDSTAGDAVPVGASTSTAARKTPLTQLLGATPDRQVFEVPSVTGSRRRGNLRSVPVHARVATTCILTTPSKRNQRIHPADTPSSGTEDLSYRSCDCSGSDTSDSDGGVGASDSEGDTWSTVSDSQARRLAVAGNGSVTVSVRKPILQARPPSPSPSPEIPHGIIARATSPLGGSVGRPSLEHLTSVLPHLTAIPHYSTANILLEGPWEVLGVPLPMIQWEFEIQLLFQIIRSNTGGLIRHALLHLWQNNVASRVYPSNTRPVDNEIPSPSPLFDPGFSEPEDDQLQEPDRPVNFHPLFDFDLEIE